MKTAHSPLPSMASWFCAPDINTNMSEDETVGMKTASGMKITKTGKLLKSEKAAKSDKSERKLIMVNKGKGRQII